MSRALADNIAAELINPGNLKRVISVSGITPQLVVPTVFPSGVLPVNVVNPISVTVPQPLGVSGVTPQLVTVTNPASVSVPVPLQVSGVVDVHILTNPVPTSGVTPQLVTVTNPGAVTVPTPLTVSGIVGISPLPVPVSGVTPQLVVPSGILYVNVLSAPSTAVNVPQPLQVSGIVTVNNIIQTVAVSGVTPQLVTVTNPSSVSVPQPLAVSGVFVPLTYVSGVVSISTNPVPVSGVTPQLVVDTVVSGILATISSQIPVTIGQHGAAGSLSIVPAIAQIFTVSGAISVLPNQFINVSGSVGISTNPVPVSGVTPQLVTVTNPSEVVLPSGILSVNVINNPLPVSGVTPQLVTVTNPTAVSPSFVNVSGVVGLTPLPIPVSGIYLPLINVSGVVSLAGQPIAVSGVTPQLVTVTNPTEVVLPSGILSVNIINNPVPVSGVTTQLVYDSTVSSQLPVTIGQHGAAGSLSIVPAIGQVFTVSGTVSVLPNQFINISGSIGISTNPVPVSGVTPQLVTVTNPSSLSIPQPLQVSGIVAVVQDTTPWAVSGVTPQLVVPTVIGSGIQPVNIVGGSVGITIPQPLLVSGAVSLYPGAFTNVSGVVSVIGTISTSGVTPQLVEVQPLPLPVSGVTPQLVTVTNPSLLSIPQPLQVSGIVAVIQDTTPWAVSGVTSQLVTQAVGSFVNVSGVVGISTNPVPVSGVTPQLVQIQPLPIPTSGVTPQLTFETNPNLGVTILAPLGAQALVNAVSVNVVKTQPPISGIVTINASSGSFISVSGVVGISTNPVPVSGVTPQLVVDALAESILNNISANQLPVSLGSKAGGSSLSVVPASSGNPWPVSGVTPQLVVETIGTIGQKTFISFGQLPPSGISPLTPETRYVAGTKWLPVGTNIYYTLDSLPQAVTVSTDQNVYAAIKIVSGVLINTYPGLAYLGNNSTDNFSLPVSGVIDIVAANNDTSIHTFSGFWLATSP
jgi:hypothetical protein